MTPRRVPFLPRRSIFEEKSELALALGWIAIGGQVVGFAAGVVFPHPAYFDERGLIAVQLVMLSLATYTLVARNNVPAWFLHAAVPIGCMSTTVAVWFSGNPTSAFALFFIWTALFAFCFLAGWEAAIAVVQAIGSFALLLALMGTGAGSQASSNAGIPYFVVITGTLLVAGSLLLYSRGRLEALMDRLSGAARTDLLTDLPNARGMNELIATEIERDRLSGGGLSVLIVDLDRLRSVNEELGNRTGDRALREIGELMSDDVRPIDAVGRTGPSEFTVLLPECDEGVAFLTAERLLAGVRTYRIEDNALTASAGIAAHPAHGRTVEELTKHARRALAAAKKLGRDRTVVSSPEVRRILADSVQGRPKASAHLTMIMTLAEALDLREPENGEHCAQVGAYAWAIARELGFNDYRAERVRIAGILHDIGKIGVADSILYREGPLDDDEWEQMKRHPEIGARILGSSELADIREWVLCCHEQPDGQGYPRGLAGGEIPLESRIVCVADAYEAMTADRAYRPAIGDAAAREELRLGAGTRYDAEVVEALLSVLEREGVRVPHA